MCEDSTLVKYPITARVRVSRRWVK